MTSEDPQSEATVLSAARNGDGDAFERLIRAHGAMLRTIAARMTNDEADAEDVLQESLSKAWVKLASFNERSTLSTWLARIVMNTALDHRSQRVHRERAQQDAYTASRRKEPQSDALEQAEAAEQRELVRRAVDRLNPNHRAVIVLHGLQGRSYAEVAQVLQCPIGTVMSRVHYAKLALRKEMESLIRSKP